MDCNYCRQYFITIAKLFLFLGIITCVSCSKESKSNVSVDSLEVYRIKDVETPYYLFKYGDEVYNIFYNWGNNMDIDSVCEDLGVEIDTAFSIDISGEDISFDTIYYSNYCYEGIIFDRQSVIFTKDECFVHICCRVGHLNIRFKLADYEKDILGYLMSSCGILSVPNGQVVRFTEEEYAINARFRCVYKASSCEVIVSDTSPEYKKYSLLNSFILGLSNKYKNKYSFSDEECAPFLLPI